MTIIITFLIVWIVWTIFTIIDICKHGWKCVGSYSRLWYIFHIVLGIMLIISGLNLIINILYL